MNAGFGAVNGGNWEWGFAILDFGFWIWGRVNRKWLIEKRGSKIGNGEWGFRNADFGKS